MQLKNLIKIYIVGSCVATQVIKPLLASQFTEDDNEPGA